MRKIVLMHTGGPYGDACSSYTFTIPNKMTLRKFVELIVNENPKEWGDIEDNWKNKTYAEYRWGEIKYFVDNPDKIIIDTKGYAHGGWTAMNYYVRGEEECEQLKIDLDSIDYSFVINIKELK